MFPSSPRGNILVISLFGIFLNRYRSYLYVLSGLTENTTRHKTNTNIHTYTIIYVYIYMCVYDVRICGQIDVN